MRFNSSRVGRWSLVALGFFVSVPTILLLIFCGEVLLIGAQSLTQMLATEKNYLFGLASIFVVLLLFLLAVFTNCRLFLLGRPASQRHWRLSAAIAIGFGAVLLWDYLNSALSSAPGFAFIGRFGVLSQIFLGVMLVLNRPRTR